MAYGSTSFTLRNWDCPDQQYTHRHGFLISDYIEPELQKLPSGAIITKMILYVKAYHTWGFGGGNANINLSAWICPDDEDKYNTGINLIESTKLTNGETWATYQSEDIKSNFKTTYPYTLDVSDTSLSVLSIYFETTNIVSRRYYHDVSMYVEFHTHDYSASVTTNPTCTSAGVTKYTCDCGDNYTENTPSALGHDYASTFTVDKKATCTTDGTKSNHCSRCSAKINITVIPKRGHNLKDTSVKTAATCLESGVMNQSCANIATNEYEACSYTTTRVIQALGHNFSQITQYKAPTCLTTGNDSYKQCVTCNKYFAGDAAVNSTGGENNTNSFTIPQLGHNYNVVVTRDSTCTDTGIMTYTCQNDTSHYYTEVINAKGHSFTATIAEDKYIKSGATCTDKAVYYKSCVRCGLSSKGQTGESTFTSGSALGHSWNATTYTWASDGKTCTATRVCKNNANHIETATATIKSAIKTPATSSEMGTTTYTATFSDVSWAKTQTKDIKDLYLVSWYNENGTVLLESDNCVYRGEIPEYNGATPTKPKDERHTWKHIGWGVDITTSETVDLEPVIVSIKYYARFEAIENKYTVIWMNNDGYILDTDTLVPYGDSPSFGKATPKHSQQDIDPEYNYTFLGWSAEVYDEYYREEEDLPTVSGINGTIIYTAVYSQSKRSYTVNIITSNCSTEVNINNKLVSGFVSGIYNYGTRFDIRVISIFGYELEKIEVKTIDLSGAEHTTEYHVSSLENFELQKETTIYCHCVRSWAPIYNGKNQQVKTIYIVPKMKTIVYQVEGELPVLDVTVHEVDGWHFSVINTNIENTGYSQYQCYMVDELYIANTRIW